MRLNAICPGVVDTAIVPESFKSRPMMHARVLAEEVVDLLTHGVNGEIRVKITEERPSFSVDPTPLA
jgi:NAD(P)-dependent dehydrogenase (short-subunit alcohol dehydrogenase family)